MENAYLSGYLQRIGFEGEPAPTWQVLRELHQRHVTTIGFENLASVMGQVVPLDIASIYTKLVERKRGGFCFEHNLLLAHVLRAIGFPVTQLAARREWQVPQGAVMPRTHMILKVEAEGKPYIVDGGFGGQTLAQPIHFTMNEPQATPCGENRVIQGDNGLFLMQVKTGDEWRSIYSFDMQVQHLIDYEVSNWFICAHPDSHFRKDLIASAVGEGMRYALLNNRFTAYNAQGELVEKTWLHTAEEMREVFCRKLNITLPEDAEVMAVLAAKAALSGE